jgi:hypothetical protein
MLSREFNQQIMDVATSQQQEYYPLYCDGMSKAEIGRICGVSRPAVSQSLKRLESLSGAAEIAVLAGSVQAMKPDVAPLPAKGEVKRHIFTSAQNNTKVNKDVWANLLALSEYYEADIHVSQFTYVKTGSRTHSTAKLIKGSNKGDLKSSEISYDPIIAGFESNKPLRICEDLIWCGEMNILPTAVNPLSGMDSYTKSSSSIFPHAKIALQCVATMKHNPTKMMYTTGCVTERNYIPQKAGLKASFHHAYGALLVEVDSDGVWFARQLNADNDGTIYDLDVVAEGGSVFENSEGFTAYNPGDIHAESLCPLNEEAIWGGEDSVVEVMRPDYVMLHDLVDFRSRNHHDVKDPHKNFRKHIEGVENVRDEMNRVVKILRRMQRDFCQLVVVDSNHDRAVERWLKEANFKTDPVNAVFYLECTLAVYKAIEAREDQFHLVEWVLKNLGADSGIQFLHPDESFTVAGIQMGEHGDHGANGSRGGPNSLKKTGEKINVGHSHTAGIFDGLYYAGMNGKLDQEYNKGHSSWSASDIGTYPNGKRVIITKRDVGGVVKWRHG